MALPAFAAERRAAAPCYHSPVAGKAAHPLLQRDGQTDRRTDGCLTVA